MYLNNNNVFKKPPCSLIASCVTSNFTFTFVFVAWTDVRVGRTFFLWYSQERVEEREEGEGGGGRRGGGGPSALGTIRWE